MRILSLHPSTTELAFAIGAGDMLIGRTDACTYPANARKLPTCGKLEELSEVVISIFEPELVLAGPGQEQLLSQLKNTRTFQLAPQSLEELYVRIEELGAMLGKSVEAEMIVHELRTALEHVAEKAKRYKPLRVYLETSHAPQQAATGYLKQILAIARATPFEGEVTIDALALFDPQIIISCVPCEDEYNTELLCARDGWERLTAVKYERVFVIAGDLLHHPGPRMIEGARTLAKFLHGISAQ